MSCHVVIPFEGSPNNWAVESSKLVTNRAELFPCGVVFLALSTIENNLYFLTACNELSNSKA
ncbi:hypothetical protein DPV86_03975 [Haemophilus parahaemolyticus]|uniref:Uncharacterized protein n=1 Tax=Haemophilus parahaemolyticus TaxID=735 RepID=A0A369Z4T6_HAEPH|nr:hypothetical protein DPV86_03975 [Haemophilus parahaemolyticus]RDF00127.1 hypothetical protein DPV98_10000 [Haemophilus parahaemolyticus]